MFSCKSLWRSLVVSWATSFALHTALVALILAEAAALISLSFQPAAPTSPHKVVTIASGWAKLAPAKESIPLKISQAEEVIVPPSESSPAAAPAATPALKPVDGQAVVASQVNSMLERSVEAAAEKSAEENLNDLRKLTGTLNSVSSDQSLNGLLDGMNRVLQTGPRATEPSAEPVAGEFDFNTAQIHDVRREENGAGGFNYTAVMLDAAGRTLDSELDEETGARIYEVMSLIKQNPLLATLYRKTLMSLFDKMLNPNAAQPSATSTTQQNSGEGGSELPSNSPAEIKPNSPQPGVLFDPFAE